MAVEAAPVAGKVVVTASDYVFHLPDEIASGWTTFEFVNRGREPHFFLFTRLAEGRAFADHVESVGPAFDKAWRALRTGASKEAAGGILGADRERHRCGARFGRDGDRAEADPRPRETWRRLAGRCGRTAALAAPAPATSGACGAGRPGAGARDLPGHSRTAGDAVRLPLRRGSGSSYALGRR